MPIKKLYIQLYSYIRIIKYILKLENIKLLLLTGTF